MNDPVDLLITNVRFPDAPFQEPGSLLVRDGRIAAVGETDVAMHNGDGRYEVLDAGGGIVVPGMVDTHRHTWQAVVRGLCGDMSAIQYLQSIRWGVARHFTADDVYTGTYVGALDMLDGGVTQVVDFSHCMNSPDHADAAYEALAASGIRATFAYGFNAVPGDSVAFRSHDERIADFRRVVDTYRGRNELITVGVALSDFNQTDLDTLRTEIAVAREAQVPITLHPGALRPRTPYGTVTLLHEAGLLGPDMILAHCTNATGDELRFVRDAGAWVSCTPETEMQMGMGFPKIGKLRELGMKPTLGVDVVSDCSGDLFAQARLALQTERALIHRDGMLEHIPLTARDVLRWPPSSGPRRPGAQG
ncbi:amidohydrolase family protein [Pseudonocardia kujensis]|uniref:amidohydrolase family protein n=1 Tax=Pseudonocardia kujensis TaxID=1128675 RepID=UPI001E2C585A|nr:amidohydrolase family protein [Pseudonocardia kujensis]MCE0764079.1 amidohydrolase family protein [Pseudonocardia kujensis]